MIDLTEDYPDNSGYHDNVLTTEELDELYSIQQELERAPTPPEQLDSSRALREEFDDVEHPVEREAPPKQMTARLSPELRRKPGRKLVGTLLE